MTELASILAWGIATVADGDSREQADALVEGRPHYQRHPRWVGRDGQRQIMCWASGLRDHVDFASRVALLAQRAWSACRQAQLQQGMQPARAELILALPLVLGFHPDLRENFTAAAARLNFDGMTSVQLIFGEHAVGLAVFERAAAALTRGGARHVYIAAADTLVAPMILDMLAAKGELRDRHNPWNPVPSEAAVCMLIARPQDGWTGVSQHPCVMASASRIEDMFAEISETACDDGDSLTEAARESLAQMPDVARIVSDASGCRWRAEELGRVTSALSVHVQDAPIFTAAQAVGDVGAATALLSVVMGLSAGPGGSLILASERSGSRRSAIVIPAARAGASGLSCGGAGLALG